MPHKASSDRNWVDGFNRQVVVPPRASVKTAEACFLTSVVAQEVKPGSWGVIQDVFVQTPGRQSSIGTCCFI